MHSCAAASRGSVTLLGPSILYVCSASVFLRGPILVAAARTITLVPAMTRYLRERKDGDLVLGVIGQVLVQIGQAGRIPAELVIHHP